MPQGGFRQLAQVQEFLLDVSIYDALETIAQKYNFSQDRLKELLDLCEAIIRGKLNINQVPLFLGKAFGIDEEKAKQVACDLVGYRLLPLCEFIADVEKSIKSWGGEIADYPSLRIKKPLVDDEITAFAKEIGLELPEHLLKRFVFLAKGYTSKERNRDATLTLLMRPITIGGLEMTKDQADKLFVMLDNKFVISSSADSSLQPSNISLASSNASLPSSGLTGGSSDLDENGSPIVVGDRKVEVEEREELVEVKKEAVEDRKEEKNKVAEVIEVVTKNTTRTRELLPIKAVPHALTTEVPVISGSIMHKDEEVEVARFKKQLEKSSSANDAQYNKKQDEIINKTSNSLFPLFKECKLTQQTAFDIASAFVRGRLEAQRTNALLVDKYKISQDKIYPILSILKAGFDELHKKPNVKPQGSASIVKVAEQEKRLLNERHAAITKTVASESVESVLASARVSASRTKDEEIKLGREKVSCDNLREAQEKSKPKKAIVSLSAQSIPVKNKQNVSQKVVDVVYSQKLVGPIEELGTMGIVEFRRLSSDPKEAIEKIFGILELLESDDYEQKVKGVLAWRKSPLQELYLSLSQEALITGSSIADISTSRRNKGEASLSTAEVEAIVVFNNRIMF